MLEPEKPENWIKASPQALAAFFLNLNTIHEFRGEFLKDPITMLEKHGIDLSPKAKDEIISKINELVSRTELEIAVVPDWGDYGVELLENGWGFWFKNATQDPLGIT